MPYRLIKFALSKQYNEPQMFHTPDRLKPRYDVVIIGAGGHGLAAAYYLARDYKITNIAVLEQSYLGSGGTGRNTAIVRSNYLTPEGVRFYDESLRLFQDLSEDLDINLFYSERGHFTLAHTDATLRTIRWRAEVNKLAGIETPIVVHPLQASVTEPLKPWLNCIIVSGESASLCQPVFPRRAGHGGVSGSVRAALGSIRPRPANPSAKSRCCGKPGFKAV